MYIVADNKRASEFDKKLHYRAFKELVDDKRVTFLSYETLNKIYDQTIGYKKI